MASTSHPLVLDLGQVRGLVTTSGQPSGTGAEGELRIDPATGDVWKMSSGTWTIICQLALAGNVKQSDWGQSNTSAIDFIKNKPTIPAEQIQSDWNQTNSAEKDYIKNKPTISNTIAKNGTNLVPSGVIFDELQKVTPHDGTRFDLSSSIGGTGTFGGTIIALKYGNIVEVRMVYYNSDPSVWRRKIAIGSNDVGTRLIQLPEEIRPRALSRIDGYAQVTGNTTDTAKSVRCNYRLYSNADSRSPGGVFIGSLYPNEQVKNTSNETITVGSVGDVSEVWITGISLFVVYTVQD